LNHNANKTREKWFAGFMTPGPKLDLRSCINVVTLRFWGVRGGAVRWGTARKSRRFLGRFPMGLLAESFRLYYGSGAGSMYNSYLLGVKAVSA